MEEQNRDENPYKPLLAVYDDLENVPPVNLHMSAQTAFCVRQFLYRQLLRDPHTGIWGTHVAHVVAALDQYLPVDTAIYAGTNALPWPPHEEHQLLREGAP